MCVYIHFLPPLCPSPLYFLPLLLNSLPIFPRMGGFRLVLRVFVSFGSSGGTGILSGIGIGLGFKPSEGASPGRGGGRVHTLVKLPNSKYSQMGQGFFFRIFNIQVWGRIGLNLPRMVWGRDKI